MVGSGFKKRRRTGVALSFFCSVPLMLTLLPAPSGAALVPLGSCYDLVSFDGLSTAGSAFSCADALRSSGYDLAAGFRNKSAKQALARLPGDGVFFFGGHSIVFGSPPGAIALVFEYPAPGQSIDALIGDPKFTPLLQGPVTLCGNNNQCRNAFLVSYPWAQFLAKHNLVVLMSSNPGQGNLLVTPMTTLVKLAGAGTVIGFKASPTCPPCTSWASIFWGALKNGADYRTAVINAAGVGGGFQTWVLLQNPGAPKRLRPPSYYPGPGSLNSTATAPLGGAADWRSEAVAQWLGRRIVPPNQWVRVDRGDGSRFQGQVPGIGLFEVDAESGDVKEAILESELGSPASAGTISETIARETASKFAQHHFGGFGELVVREDFYVDHGDFREYRYLWQARAGEAWLPTRVAVGINAATGRLAYYSSATVALEVSTIPRISRELARKSTYLALAHAGPLRLGEPVLEVVVTEEGTQRLVWIEEAYDAPSDTPHVPVHLVFWTDAMTGRSEVIARG